MLSDILATIIAFISVILLLSVVVTALVQMSQAVFRLRSRNLMKGMAALLVNARVRDGSLKKTPTRLDKRNAKKDATKILNASNVALMDTVEKPEEWVRYWLLGPKVSWVDSKELPSAIKEAKINVGKETAAQYQEEFEKSEMHFKKRFLRTTRLWSIGWALIVAVAFQVSAPTLFNELARDSERRNRIVADAEQLLAYEAESLANINSDTAAPEALERLATNHDQHRERIEEAIGIGTTRTFILDELALALEGIPEQDALVAEYDQLLDEVAQIRFEQTSEELDKTLNQLRSYDIELWPRGSEYYFEGRFDAHWDAIIGVFITAVLLSFGGSFWFARLRDVLALRDTLARGKPESESGDTDRAKPDGKGKVTSSKPDDGLTAESDGKNEPPAS